MCLEYSIFLFINLSMTQFIFHSYSMHVIYTHITYHLLLLIFFFTFNFYVCTNVLIYLFICICSCIYALESIRFDCIHVFKCDTSLTHSMPFNFFFFSFVSLLYSTLCYCTFHILCERAISQLSNCFRYFYCSSDIIFFFVMFCIILFFFYFRLHVLFFYFIRKKKCYFVCLKKKKRKKNCG